MLGGAMIASPLTLPNDGVRRAASLDRAHETLMRGAAYLDRHVAPRCDAGVHAPFIGNALGELDRFLNVLVDEVADWIGAPVRPKQRNTANKLSALHRVTGAAVHRRTGHARLSAIGRSREFLKHAGGRDATAAGRMPKAILPLSSAEMTAICRLYSDTARDLHATALALRPR
jgi:hypothetical protein